jgi:preprotein translocase subunit SecG
MYTLITILIVAVCVFLTLIVLVQNSKGGGLAANFSSSNQIMGVRKTADFLEKATWTLSSSLIFLCILAAFLLPPTNETGNSGSMLDQQIQNIPAPGEIPEFQFPAQSPTTDSVTPTE